MFLHSGAAFHGHEFSPQSHKRTLADSRLRSNSVPRRAPLTRSAYSTPIPPKSTIYENPLPILSRSARPLSDQLCRSSEPVVRFQDPETMSEDGRSVANSEGSDATIGGRRKRRAIRTSTAFHLAHPAPTLTQKQRLLHIRPKLLLQLQRLSADSRPMPAVDVLPSTVVVPRLQKKFPRMFRGKGELGCNDVMVVKSEEYHTPHDNVLEESDSDEDGLANRDLMAVICQMPKDSGGASGKAEIVLNDGSVWISTPLPNGLYEFLSIDERGHRTTARWVKRSIKRGSVDTSESTYLSDFKFTFSIIDPNSRRHPILATITQNKLDIPDFYTSVSQSAGKFPPTSPIRGEAPLDEANAPERMTHAIEENTKQLIQVTGIWLALREGWSPYFKYNDAMSPQTTPISRSMSLTPDGCRPSPVFGYATTPESVNSMRTLGALGSKIRRASTKASPINADFTTKTVPQRSISAGTAFMQREKARRIGNPPSTVPSDSEGEGSLIQSYIAPEGIVGYERMPTPPTSLTLPRSEATIPETPTRPHRRGQSISASPTVLQNAVVNAVPQRHSMLEPTGKQSATRVKVSRWKSFTGLFRRTKSPSTEQ